MFIKGPKLKNIQKFRRLKKRMSGPWASTTQPTAATSSLRDVMSEQAAESPEDDVLARALAESAALAKEERSRRGAFSPVGDSSTDCTSDVVM